MKVTFFLHVHSAPGTSGIPTCKLQNYTTRTSHYTDLENGDNI